MKVIQIKNPKIEKVDAEIERIESRISKLQEKLEMLRCQRADMYNADMLSILKDIPLEEVHAFAKQRKGSDFAG